MFKKFFTFSVFCLLCTFLVHGQGDELKGWQLEGSNSKRPGTSINDVYKNFLKNKPGFEVIVAVIDGGVDVNHEDLKQNIWINPKEIAGNGIDDDHNGYIDDVHGWNFIGNAAGENVHYDTYETTRTLATLKKKYKDIKPEAVPKENQEEFKKYKEMVLDIDTKKQNAEDQWNELKRNETILIQVIEAVKKEMGSLHLNKVNVEKVDTNKNVYVNVGVKILKQILEEQPMINSFDQINNSIREEYSVPREDLESKFLYQYNTDYDSRKIVGDHYEDVTEKFYGNNDVKGPDAMHGTHVAGIIAAVRGNGIGMDGIASNAKIMALRVVPDGDERDKDIANAIHYAVDNGARIINMSFGKGESPYKKAVDEAVLYAEKHDVLLVHAAGNAADDNDVTPSFPISSLDRKGLFVRKKAKN
ncbi:MAG: S8 family serine peptidase, partial [Saprospiraceae bacterium]